MIRLANQREKANQKAKNDLQDIVEESFESFDQSNYVEKQKKKVTRIGSQLYMDKAAGIDGKEMYFQQDVLDLLDSCMTAVDTGDLRLEKLEK